LLNQNETFHNGPLKLRHFNNRVISVDVQGLETLRAVGCA